jgi:hypothetical protein
MASQWGRSGIPLLESDSGARHASRSLRCAIAAATLVVIALIAFIALHPQVTEGGDGFASMVLGIAYFVAAPLLLLAGCGFGIASLRYGSGDRGFFAIGLNVLLFVAGGVVAVVSIYLA